MVHNQADCNSKDQRNYWLLAITEKQPTAVCYLVISKIHYLKSVSSLANG